MFPVYITYLNKHAKCWLALDSVHLLNSSHKPTSNEIHHLHSCRSCHFLDSFLFYWSRLNDRQGCQRRVAFDFLSHKVLQCRSLALTGTLNVFSVWSLFFSPFLEYKTKQNFFPDKRKCELLVHRPWKAHTFSVTQQ